MWLLEDAYKSLDVLDVSKANQTHFLKPKFKMCSSTSAS